MKYHGLAPRASFKEVVWILEIPPVAPVCSTKALKVSNLKATHTGEEGIQRGK